MARTTLLDIAKMNGCDKTVGLIDEASRFHPEIQLFQARTVKGLNYPTLVRTALPTVGFRKANDGPTASKSTWERRLVECFILNPRAEVDKAIADSHEDGPEAFMQLEMDGHLNAAFGAVASQIYYGTAADAAGFAGFAATVDSSMVVDAGGTTASTGSSVWAVSFGEKATQLVVGMNGDISVSDMMVAPIIGENDAPLTGYIQEILARVGLQIGHKYAIGRIRDLTADSGKGLTDALLGSLLAKFPVGRKPDCLLMSRRSLEQWRASRTAVNATGAEAPTPTSYEGIPAYATDSIVNTEALS